MDSTSSEGSLLSKRWFSNFVLEYILGILDLLHSLWHAVSKTLILISFFNLILSYLAYFVLSLLIKSIHSYSVMLGFVMYYIFYHSQDYIEWYCILIFSTERSVSVRQVKAPTSVCCGGPLPRHSSSSSPDSGRWDIWRDSSRPRN